MSLTVVTLMVTNYWLLDKVTFTVAKCITSSCWCSEYTALLSLLRDNKAFPYKRKSSIKIEKKILNKLPRHS